MKRGDLVSTANNPALDYSCKYALARHDAVSGLVVYRAFVVTFLADLSDFHQDRFAQPETSADLSMNPVDAVSGNVFGEIPKAN